MVNDEQVRLSTVIATERKLHELACAVDDLTTLAHEEAGATTIRAGHNLLVSSAVKLQDLIMDHKP